MAIAAGFIPTNSARPWPPKAAISVLSLALTSPTESRKINEQRTRIRPRIWSSIHARLRDAQASKFPTCLRRGCPSIRFAHDFESHCRKAKLSGQVVLHDPEPNFTSLVLVV